MGQDARSWWLAEADCAGREHFDAQHARRYDSKEDAHAADEVALLRRLGVAGPGCCVVDLGTGTGQFALAAATVCERVVAVDVSPVMLRRLEEKVATGGPRNLAIVQAGFLTYEHSGAPADAVYSRLALHHLPDFWKALALARITDMLRPGGVLRLWDVVYGFPPQEAGQTIEAVLGHYTATDPEDGWTRAELVEHVRDEHSTFTWLLEPMIERAGLEIVDADYSEDQMAARYVCRRR
jgi:ubiquinone/menaquinone biosynthesis C-methylase UbiE